MVPKDFFTEDGFENTSLARDFAKGLARGELRECLANILSNSDAEIIAIEESTLIDALASLCASKNGTGRLFVGWRQRESLFRHPSFRFPVHARTGAEFGTLSSVPVVDAPDFAEGVAVYLPPMSSTVTYPGPIAGAIEVSVTPVDPARAGMIVTQWESRGEVYEDVRREEKLLELQERAYVQVRLRSTCDSNQAVLFKLLEIDGDSDEQEDNEE